VNNGDSNTAELRSALREARSHNERLESQLNEQFVLLEEVSQELELAKATNDDFQLRLTKLQVNTTNHVKKLESALKTETSKSKRLWMQKREQLLTYESELEERDQD